MGRREQGAERRAKEQYQGHGQGSGDPSVIPSPARESPRGRLRASPDRPAGEETREVVGQLGGVLVMSQIDSTEKVAPGDEVVTAGIALDGGVRSPYPKGLLIGQVVDVKDLKPEMRSKVDDVVSRTSEQDMQSLRKSIDATPEAASALKAKGLSSAQVVAINIADGVLTLFAKTA